MIPQLSAEILLVIFQHMSVLPFCHRKPGDEPLERQADLLTCTKVCRSWNILASPSLYRIPVVYSLPLFIQGLDNQPLPDLPSKRSNLKRVERLFIEIHTITPEAIPDEEVAERALSSEVDDPEQCRAELAQIRVANEILLAWQTILDDPVPPTEIFPLLHSLSTNAIAGAHRNKPWPWSEAGVELNHLALNEFLSKSGVRHFCQTGGAGPLSLSIDALYSAEKPGEATMSCHSSDISPILSPRCVGIRSRWYVHSERVKSAGVSLNHPDGLCEDAAAEITEHLHNRRHLANDKLALKIVTDWSFDGALYLNPTHLIGEVPDEDEREAASRKWAEGKEAELNALIALVPGGLPKGAIVRDHFEVKRLADSPVCDACGWDAADLSGGMYRGRK